MEKFYEGKTRITYYDLDLRGKVKLSALLRMVHIAAEINASSFGIGYSVLAPLNISFILQRFGIRIMRMPVYNETVTIRTWPESVAKGTFLRKGDMYDEAGHKLMEWGSLWILFDISARRILKPSALPVQIPELIGMGSEIMPQKIDLSRDYGKSYSSYTHTVRYAEVDTNMHMNNSVYGDLIGNVLFPNVESSEIGLDWREIQINYQAETRLGEEIDITARHEGDTFLVVGTAPGRTAFIAKVSLI